MRLPRRRREERQRLEEAASVLYGDLWQPDNEEQAMQLVLNETDPEVFEASGQRQADELLCPRIRSTDTVMDLGCGIGRVARYVAPCCGSLWAVDASEKMLSLARTRLQCLDNVRFAQSEGTRIPLVESGSVDFVYSILTLQHLEREDAFLLLREVHRVLRPGGSAFFTFPNLLSDVYLDAFLKYAEGGEVANPARARFYTPEEVRRLLPAARFDLTDMTAGVEIEVHCARRAAEPRHQI
jgi:ubiquinone/menaquinone biosynthesis C-methylase UbiE